MTTDSGTVLYVGLQRYVVALDAATGVRRWSTELPGTSLFTGFVTIHLDGAHVFAAAGGEITCLDAATGTVQWHNALEGYGFGFATLATGADAAGSTTTATEASAAAASYVTDAAAAAAAGGIAAAL
ncbi:MAG TPA: PQQ-binding-like beta-propeller repeat protein [Gemmatirosa sp.]